MYRFVTLLLFNMFACSFAGGGLSKNVEYFFTPFSLNSLLVSIIVVDAVGAVSLTPAALVCFKG